MPHPDFLILTQPQLSSGKTYVIGDVHGEILAFEAVLNALTPQDTLIIAGDLIDRGQTPEGAPASQLVLNKLLELSRAPTDTAPKTLVIKGNHEVDFLKLMTLLRGSASSQSEIEELTLKVIINGGIWMFKDATPEDTRKLQLIGAHYACRTLDGQQDQREVFLRTFIQTKLLTNVPQFLHSDIEKYEQYIASLPYIIKIDDPANPAWVAHADLPLTDEQLQRRIESNEGLTFSEILSITNTRPTSFSTIRQASEGAIRVYCGHNIIDDRPERKSYPTLAVRAEGNHVNLDGGAFFSGAFLMVNHTDNSVSLVGDNSRPIQSFLRLAVNHIQQHFDDYPYLLSSNAADSSNDDVCQNATKEGLAQLIAAQGMFAFDSATAASGTTVDVNRPRVPKRPKEDMDGEIVESKADVDNDEAKFQAR